MQAKASHLYKSMTPIKHNHKLMCLVMEEKGKKLNSDLKNKGTQWS